MQAKCLSAAVPMSSEKENPQRTASGLKRTSDEAHGRSMSLASSLERPSSGSEYHTCNFFIIQRSAMGHLDKSIMLGSCLWVYMSPATSLGRLSSGENATLAEVLFVASGNFDNFWQDSRDGQCASVATELLCGEGQALFAA